MSTLLWIRSDTTNGDTTFTDSSDYGRTISVYGNAQHSTAQQKFNATSMYFDGTGDFLTVPSSTDFDFGTDDFTIDFWLYTGSFPAYDMILGRMDAWGDSGALWVRLSPAITGVEVKIGSSAALSSGALSTNTWYHIAVVRSSGTNKIYVDGNFASQSTSAGSIFSTDALFIARNPVNSSEEYTGYLEEIRISDTALWTANFTPEAGGISTAPSPLSPPEITATVENVGYISVASPLAGAAVLAAVDYTDLVVESSVRFVMDLATPGGAVRVPISSWQATQQVDRSNYLQCVVPACGSYLDDINAATDFTISMTADLTTGESITQTMATSTLDVLATNRGPTNYTATLSGYSAGYVAQTAPPSEFDRTLVDIRSQSTSSAGTRVRCKIDWLLKPGHRAYLDETTSIIAAYVNYYVTGQDVYMDVGERQ